MKLALAFALTATLAAPAYAGQNDAPNRPSLAQQAQAIMTGPAYSQTTTWQARVAQSRGSRGSKKKAIIVGAIAGGAAGLVTGLVVENQMCGCGGGPLSGGLAALGAGGGAAIGWAVSLR